VKRQDRVLHAFRAGKPAGPPAPVAHGARKAATTWFGMGDGKGHSAATAAKSR